MSQIVSVYDKSNDVLRFLKNQKLTNHATDDIKIAVKNSELTIISSPLSAYKEIISKIKNDLNENSILTDTGSVKRIVNKIIEESNLKNVSWIASHPIAGTEESGPASGFADLFQNRWNIICPSKNAKKSHVKILEKFWKTLGSNTKIMSFDEHDKILSLTSHLPHAIAYNIVRTSLGSDQKVRDEVIKYSAGGLRDFTRIASSDPLMWRDIFIDNSENIIEILNQFSENIEKFKELIKQKKGEELFKIFESTKKVRKAIIDEGQDIDKPDFGRKKIK